ncbi:MAG: hypothetical protein HFI86_05695 [Bacilli bacterium]|nr:hypothetical protein [Bacilli bacterium]
MESNLKEEINVYVEAKKQQDLICNVINITEKVLQILRGDVPKDENECMKEVCILDTLKINSNNLTALEKNLNEIAKKIIG